MQSHRGVFESVKSSLGIHFSAERYATVEAFVLGYDAACEGGALAGFREWLVVRLDRAPNLTWPGLALLAVFPEGRQARSTQDEKNAINTLFELIAAFDDERNKHDGLRRILANYEEWSRSKGIA